MSVCAKHEHVLVCTSVPNRARVRPSEHERAEACVHVREHTQARVSVQKLARVLISVCPRVCEHTRVCMRVH